MSAAERKPTLRVVGKQYQLSNAEKAARAAIWAGDMAVVGFAVSGEIVNSGLRLANIGIGVQRQIGGKLIGFGAEAAKKPVRWALRMDTGKQTVQRLKRGEPDSHHKQAAVVVQRINHGETGLIPSVHSELRLALQSAERLDELELETSPEQLTSIAPNFAATKLQNTYLLRIMMNGLAGRIDDGRQELDGHSRQLYKELLADNLEPEETFSSIGVRPAYAALLGREFPDFDAPDLGLGQ